MKRLQIIVFALVLSLVLAVSGYASNDVLSKAAAEKWWQVSADDVLAMINAKKTDFLVVDVRPDPAMYKAGHIPGAIHIPVQDILRPDNLKKLPKDKKIILVCVTGQTQNLPIVTLRGMGYNALTMKFGMAAWDKSSVGFKFMKEALQGAETKNYPLQK